MKTKKFRVWYKNACYFNNSLILLDTSGKPWHWPWGDNAPTPMEDGTYIVQFSTGLYDKNGKEIYEGDIVKYPQDTPSVISGFYTSVVEYEELNCRFGIGFKIGGDYAEQDNIEVIGNIYQNPDLIKS